MAVVMMAAGSGLGCGASPEDLTSTPEMADEFDTTEPSALEAQASPNGYVRTEVFDERPNRRVMINRALAKLSTRNGHRARQIQASLPNAQEGNTP